jgi:hypothetical protein
MRANLRCRSAASIARVEATVDDDARKNELCVPMSMTDDTSDWVPQMLGELEAQRRWSADPELRRWLGAHRLTGANLLSRDQPDPAKLLRRRMVETMPRAVANLERLLRGQRAMPRAA